MTEVFLHVYDVQSDSEKTNTRLKNFNWFVKDVVGVGGIFHGAIEVLGYEWSFGYCEEGSGVYPCRPKVNPMYNYKETVSLGHTALSTEEIKAILRDMQYHWPGQSYHILDRNCNGFCEELARRLGVKVPPGWLNRLARGSSGVIGAYNTVSGACSKMYADIKSWVNTKPANPPVGGEPLIQGADQGGMQRQPRYVQRVVPPEDAVVQR
ncbi:unnamed protein product [Pedinophyceae sp. YPF-701]|nr:unnamed protein product [Pedinophyceae sp. YPF-701]